MFPSQRRTVAAKKRKRTAKKKKLEKIKEEPCESSS